MVSFLESIVEGFRNKGNLPKPSFKFKPLFSGVMFKPDPFFQRGPQAFNIIEDRLQTLALPDFFERIRQSQVVRPKLVKQVAQAKGFLKRTFFQDPRIGLSFFERQKLKRRIPRNVRFQLRPKGSIFGVNPFTGKLIPTGIGRRGSQKTISFLGGAANLAANRSLITRGGELKSIVQGFIDILQARITIIDANSV